MTSLESMQEALRLRMLALLEENPDPDWEMAEIYRTAYEEFGPALALGMNDAKEFVDRLFSDGPG
jgi:hypothetical protein